MSRVLESYGFLTRKVKQLLELNLIEKLKPYDINARQYGVLIKINEKPNLSQKEIAAELKIDRTTMVDFIDHLESLQYVIRIKNQKDLLHPNYKQRSRSIKRLLGIVNTIGDEDFISFNEKRTTLSKNLFAKNLKKRGGMLICQ